MAPPPGYVAYGAPGSYSPFSKVRGIAKALVIVQICVVAATALLLVLQLAIVGKAGDYVDDVITLDEFEDSLGPFLLIGLLSALLGVASLVLLIVWSYRIAGNLQKAARDPLTWKPGLTIVVWILGGCTLTIINFLMLREHWQGSDPAVPPRDGRWREQPVSPLITMWFVVGIAQIVLGFASGLQSVGGFGIGNGSRDVAESLSDRLPLVLGSGLLGIAGAALLVLIVRQLTDRHVQLIREG